MPYNPNSDPNASGGQTDAPGRRLRTVTPSDGTDLPIYANALYIGGGGDVAVLAENDADGASVVFKNVPAGGILPVQTRRVLATGTTASNIIAILS